MSISLATPTKGLMAFYQTTLWVTRTHLGIRPFTMARTQKPHAIFLGD